MLINLSSTGENSASHFTNHFLDNLTIPPNAHVSLVRCSLHRNGSHLSFTIPAGTTISYRTSPYDVYTAEICSEDTRYTSQTFVDRLNVLLNGLVAFRYEIKALLEPQGEFDFTIAIVSFNNDTKWASTNLQTFIWGDIQTYQSNVKQCRKFGGTDADLPISVKNNSELQGVRFGTQNCGFGAGWGDNITPIPNQVQSRTFNHFTTSSQAKTKFNISSGFNGDNGIRMTVSYATTLEPPDDDVYATGGGVPGMIGFGNNHPMMLKIGGDGTGALDGKLSLELHDHVNDQMDVVNAGGTAFYIGDQIEFGLEGGQTAGAAYDEAHLFSPMVQLRSNFGLVLWAGNRLDGTQYYNQYSVDAVTNTNFWDTTTDETRLDSIYDYHKGYGVRMVRGFKNGNKQQIEMDYKSDLNPVTTTQIDTYTAVGNIWDEAIFFRAYSATAGVTDIADEGQYLLLDSNGINVRNTPTFISFVMILADKSAHTTDTGRGILGGVTHPQILKFDTAGGATPDFTLKEHDGTTHTGNLTDISTTRITWTFDTPYLVQVYGFGQGLADVDIEVTDLNTGSTFVEGITTTGGGIGAIHYVGANNPANTSNEHFMHGYVADFRIYQKPQIQGMTGNYWQNLVADQQTYYQTGNWDERTGGFFATSKITNLYNGGEFKYCNFGSETNTNGTCTPFICYDGTPVQSDSDWYNLTNIHFYPCIRQPNSTRNQSETTAAIYSDRGQGIVASNELNAFLDFDGYDNTEERSIEAEADNGLDTEDNPIARIESDQTEVDIADKIFNIEIKNLPHRTYNGVTGAFDKTIYQMGSLIEGKTIEGDRIVEHYPKERVKVPLNNAGELILNQLEVQISDEFGIQEGDLKQTTNLTLEIN